MIDIAAEPDPPGIDVLLHRFRGALAFDVGANVGQSAKVLAPNFGQVVSLEPCLESFEVMCADPSIPVNVDKVFAAASSTAGRITLYEQERHLARGQLTTRQDDETTPEDEVHGWGRVIGHREVDAVRLDDLVEAYGLPDLIKCDVEGHEVEVFIGAQIILHDRTPDLFIEVHNAELGEQLVEILHPYYGDIEVVRHPHYKIEDWGWSNHYWLFRCTTG